jgi:hypothetical protein
LGRRTGSCRRDHRGGHGVDAHGALCPARLWTGHCRQLEIAWSANVAGQGGVNSPFVVSRVVVEPISLIPTHDRSAILVAL